MTERAGQHKTGRRHETSLPQPTDTKNRIAFAAIHELLEHPESIPPAVLRALGLATKHDDVISRDDRENVKQALGDSLDLLKIDVPEHVQKQIVTPPPKPRKESDDNPTT